MFTNKTNYPMALLYIDHYGKLPKSDRGNEYVLTCRDNSTRFVWLIPVKDTKSDTVVQALEENIFKIFRTRRCHYFRQCKIIYIEFHRGYLQKDKY